MLGLIEIPRHCRDGLRCFALIIYIIYYPGSAVPTPLGMALLDHPVKHIYGITVILLPSVLK